MFHTHHCRACQGLTLLEGGLCETCRQVSEDAVRRRHRNELEF